ncbi:hypothetical protein LEP1GSC102_0521 [Leptospira interrogans str. UI 09600]|nr:hypothetical protein LEP1GSC102_0521 [Leptospira interrogans str. UI 09600]
MFFVRKRCGFCLYKSKIKVRHFEILIINRIESNHCAIYHNLKFLNFHF